MKSITLRVLALILLVFFWDKIWPDSEVAAWQRTIDERNDRVSALLARCNQLDDEFETLRLAPAALTTSSDFNMVAVKTDICLKKIQAINLDLIRLYSKKPHNLPLTGKEQKELAFLKRSVADSGPKPDATPFKPKPVSIMEPDELRVVKGEIVNISSNGVVFKCDLSSPPQPNYMAGNMVDASSGAGDIAAAAQWAEEPIRRWREQESKEYGGLVMLQNGRFSQHSPIGEAVNCAKALIVGWPQSSPAQVGKKMRVVVAPTGDVFDGCKVFTTSFQMPTPKPGAWMNDPNRRSALDRR